MAKFLLEVANLKDDNFIRSREFEGRGNDVCGEVTEAFMTDGDFDIGSLKPGESVIITRVK